MAKPNDADYLPRLVRELCHLPAETQWAEFKENNVSPEMIGELISALSNAAALNGKETGYVVWGIEDGSHAITGTTFQPATAKKGNQDLESWLVQMLSPKLFLRFLSTDIDGKRVVVLEIPAARVKPTAFSGKESVRIGSTCRNLNELPDMERALWRSFDQTPFERQIALPDQSAPAVLRLLDYPDLFERLDRPAPTDQAAILEALAAEDMICRNNAGHWDITNLGAILIARDLRKSVV